MKAATGKLLQLQDGDVMRNLLILKKQVVVLSQRDSALGDRIQLYRTLQSRGFPMGFTN